MTGRFHSVGGATVMQRQIAAIFIKIGLVRTVKIGHNQPVFRILYFSDKFKVSHG
nr:hypothetical protein [Nissabacter sp. SGAir0207]